MKPGKTSGALLIAIDAGTTSVRVVCYDSKLRVIDKQQQEFNQYFPEPGLVEHDAEEIWNVTKKLLDKVLRGRANQVRGIGITNQRETVVLWNKKTGKPTHKAIVWQDRRTTQACKRLKRRGLSSLIQRSTGLVLDAYFSATKIRWLLDETKQPAKDLITGTIDSWLIWNLTGGSVHATDYTNASRTLLYNIDSKQWDPKLLKIFRVPAFLLPEVKNSTDDFGTYRGIPIAGVAGDQQSAMCGQAAFYAGQGKNTYGTGCFMLLNTGYKHVRSRQGLITTLTPGSDGKPRYALEGSVFIGGALIQWLRDKLGIIQHSGDVGKIAAGVSSAHGVYIVPAFAGLGAPYWNQEARGVITGLTRGADTQHIIRAAEEAIAYQVYDLAKAMQTDSGTKFKQLRVDGGAVHDDFLMQYQADILNMSITRPTDVETTVRGAAMLAGLQVGMWKSLSAAANLQMLDRTFKPSMTNSVRQAALSGWAKALRQAQTK
ncbi:MAG: glycerol kinase [Candidatus Kerfeldbacteria bacterium CG15_BIG_FIL_POST_REV_8_21_14_020_45_12]|uniref:glycerol kinase n=1 Tax=Candidatus Kerfeldbacteria bacterium CG15_BIG_FIL_POST_REV_8_21_14_020_45_12 TaxID=2014247 RepID=A0A2M7H4L1_9BACT|nr:MAG: glycerol kinase [Candidatus Kerfeldbacteria bacterium CG15_BIG_FIL_POST_REV_8_21_14_020_45_12]PJA93926.1 MAG: glycerol kinase [Candidatus Kerfeldbacteria bacterium CG_4_9_14_3_um_filter_45_8]